MSKVNKITSRKITSFNKDNMEEMKMERQEILKKLGRSEAVKSSKEIQSKRFIKSGAGAGYDVTIEGIELDTNNIEILESTADSVHVKVPVKSCIVEWKAEDYYNSVSSDGLYVDDIMVQEYTDEDKRVDGGYVQFTIDVWENESAEDIINDISRVVPDYVDFTAQYGFGWSHVNLPEDGMNFEYKDIKDPDIGAYGEMHLDSVELKCPNISENINWFFAHDHELEDIFFGEEEEIESSRKFVKSQVSRNQTSLNKLFSNAERKPVMSKITQRELREMAEYGKATDITRWSTEDIRKLGHLEKLQLSRGTYGMNGGLFQDDDGNLYVVTARSTNLFMLA